MTLERKADWHWDSAKQYREKSNCSGALTDPEP